MSYSIDLGTGNLGNVILSYPTQINSYANITSISSDGRTLLTGQKSIGIYGGFVQGQQILFHVTGCLTSETTSLGIYGFSTISSSSSGGFSVNSSLPIIDLTKYVCQAVIIPQFNNLTITCKINALSYDISKKCGGILLAKVKGIMNITSGMFLSEGNGLPYGSSLKPSGVINTNSGTSTKLIMSTGNGIVVPICNILNLSATSRIGASWDGSIGAGVGGISYYSGVAGSSANGSSGGAGGAGNSGNNPGGAGGIAGYSGSKAQYAYGGLPGPGGSTILLISNTINGYTASTISSGGGSNYNGAVGGLESVCSGTNGGSGYGAGGGGGDGEGSGSGGGGGGGSGYAYISTNTPSFPTNTTAYALDTLNLLSPAILPSIGNQLSFPYPQSSLESFYPIG